MKNDAVLEVRLDNRVIQSRKKPHVQPSEMISVTLDPKDLADAGPDSTIEIAIL